MNILKTLYVIIGLTIINSINGQIACTQTWQPAEIFYPNTISNPSTAITPRYLCGPNTVVYDTLSMNVFYHYVSSNCTLTIKGVSSSVHFIYMKTNSTLNILKGTIGNVDIWFEPGVTINNPYNLGTWTVQCNTISFPTVNCSTGLTEITNQETGCTIWPNPSSTKINIDITNFNDQSTEVRIINQLGEIVYDRKRWLLVDREINIENLSNGIYFIQVKTKRGQQTEKIIVLR